MREMAKNIAVVEARHGDLRDDHFQECRESGEYTKLVFVESESGCSGEVASLHDTRCDEDFGVFLVNDRQTGGSLEITYLKW